MVSQSERDPIMTPTAGATLAMRGSLRLRRNPDQRLRRRLMAAIEANPAKPNIPGPGSGMGWRPVWTASGTAATITPCSGSMFENDPPMFSRAGSGPAGPRKPLPGRATAADETATRPAKIENVGVLVICTLSNLPRGYPDPETISPNRTGARLSRQEPSFCAASERVLFSPPDRPPPSEMSFPLWRLASPPCFWSADSSLSPGENARVIRTLA